MNKSITSVSNENNFTEEQHIFAFGEDKFNLTNGQP